MTNPRSNVLPVYTDLFYYKIQFENWNLDWVKRRLFGAWIKPCKQLQTEDFRKQQSIKGISNWMKTDISSRKKGLVIVAKNYTEVDFKVS